MARVLFKYVFLSFLLLLGRTLDAAISPIPFSDSLNGRSIGLNTEILMDPSGALNAVQAEGSAGFHACMQDVPNLGLSRTAYWVRFTVTNESHSPEIILKVPSPEIERLDLYVLRSGQPELICRTGQAVRPADRPFMDGEYGMPLNIPLQGTSTYLLRVHGLKQLLLPMHLNTEKGYFQDKDLRSLIAGALFGIFLVMALYNLFLYFSVRDISYLIYVMYILLVCVTQLNFLGYAQLYFWPSATAFALRSSQVLTVLTAAAAGIFMHQFTRASQFAPSSRYLTPAFVALLFAGLGVGYVGFPLLGYKILQISVASFSTYMLTIALICWWRGFRPAAFFSVAWALFLVGITAFVLKDMGLLPYTWFTKYLMPMGSVAEVILLSFGLADKINVLRR
ncbi:MAG: 7TM diverse intracellular signaling domain-containing protein, partial [Flavobacteriales bacterium]